VPNGPTAIASRDRAAICDLSGHAPGGEKNGTKWQLGTMFRATSLSDLQPGCARLFPLVPLVSGGEGVSGREPKRDQNHSSFSGGWRGRAELLARHIAAAHEDCMARTKLSKIAGSVRRLHEHCEDCRLAASAIFAVRSWTELRIFRRLSFMTNVPKATSH
jgi:hypothetical protein